MRLPQESSKPGADIGEGETFTKVSDRLAKWPGVNWTDRFIYARIERYQQMGEAYPSHATLGREASITLSRPCAAVTS